MKHRALITALIAVAALGVAPAHAATAQIDVGNNFFSPQKAVIAVGDSVLWNVLEDGHTITANDGSFDEENLGAGDTFSWGPFNDDVTFFYRCKVHAEMFGVIEVGDGTPVPPGDDGPSEIRRVCRDDCQEGEYASIGDALATALPRALIELEPGTYDEAVVLNLPGVVLRGVGATSADVILTGTGSRLYTVSLFGEDVGIEHLTVTAGGLHGIYANQVDGFHVTDVIATANARAGIMVEDARGGTIADSIATANGRGGIVVDSCIDCDVLVERLRAENNFVGIDVDHAGGIIVRDSIITGNRTGIALRTTWIKGEEIDPSAPQRGTHILGNTITSNMSTATPSAPIAADAPLQTGSGVWIGGGSHNVIQGNAIDDHLYGVVVTGIVGPSMYNSVLHNTVSTSSAADIAWDGIGLGTCFAGNTAPGGEPVTEEPPVASTIYDCALPMTVGVPYPSVTYTVLDYAT